MFIHPALLQFSHDLNHESDRTFNQTVKAAAWAIYYETEIEAGPIKVAAEILLKEYVPLSTQYSCYSGYGQGDDNLYPIE